MKKLITISISKKKFVFLFLVVSWGFLEVEFAKMFFLSLLQPTGIFFNGHMIKLYADAAYLRSQQHRSSHDFTIIHLG